MDLPPNCGVEGRGLCGKTTVGTVPVTEPALSTESYTVTSLSSPLHTKKRDAVANCCGSSCTKAVDDIQDIITLLKIYSSQESTLNPEVSKTLR